MSDNELGYFPGRKFFLSVFEVYAEGKVERICDLCPDGTDLCVQQSLVKGIQEVDSYLCLMLCYTVYCPFLYPSCILIVALVSLILSTGSRPWCCRSRIVDSLCNAETLHSCNQCKQPVKVKCYINHFVP